MGQDSSGRFDGNQRPNDLPSPQKILTAPSRTQAGRFGGGTNTVPQSNEQVPRFPSFNNRNQPSQSADSSASNSTWNNDQNKKSTFSSGGNGNFSNQQNNNRSQFDSMKITVNSNMDENRTVTMNNTSRFSSNNNDNQQSSYEQRRPVGM